MCAILGVLSNPRFNKSSFEIMLNKLSHRGEDGSGIWEGENVILGHRRLAIQDLTDNGSQPMHSRSGRFIVVFNGEIYNFIALREEIFKVTGVSCDGGSDTEVILAAIDLWGWEKSLNKFVGMFAIALWDKELKTLILARDRTGEKPLYYGYINNEFVFASELKAIKAHYSSSLEIDRDALNEFMSLSYIPAPKSIYKGLYKLPAASYIPIKLCESVPKPIKYWDFIGEDTESKVSEKDQLLELKSRLKESVSKQCISDAPLGAFLSGGVDSSLICSIMQEQSDSKINTFTIGFEEKEFDESPYAREVAKHIGTYHTEMKVTARDAINIIPDLPYIYDEPFADSSQIPTVLVSRLTREHVKVALTGDGGDELFAGYPRYQLANDLWRKISRIPKPIRSQLSPLLSLPSEAGWNKILSLLPDIGRGEINGRRLRKLGHLGKSQNIQEMYQRLMMHWQPEDNLVLNANGRMPHDYAIKDICNIKSMQASDTAFYLPDDLLVKVDRAAMSCGLESRAPFLDFNVIETAFSLTEMTKIKGGVGKWPLRYLLDDYVPRKLIERPKAGFSVPLADWLRGPLKDWAEELLSFTLLEKQGYLDAKLVRKIWSNHLTNKYDAGIQLWNILMFQAWLEIN